MKLTKIDYIHKLWILLGAVVCIAGYCLFSMLGTNADMSEFEAKTMVIAKNVAKQNTNSIVYSDGFMIITVRDKIKDERIETYDNDASEYIYLNNKVYQMYDRFDNGTIKPMTKLAIEKYVYATGQSNLEKYIKNSKRIEKINP